MPIIINDKAGRAGVAYWINQQFNLPPERQVSKKHPAVGQIHTRIMAAYEEGRNTSFSNKEIKNLVRRFMPELFDSEFDQMKRIAGELASNLVERLAATASRPPIRKRSPRSSSTSCATTRSSSMPTSPT